jgi:nucleoside-diphosphate-sugar epimerase
VDDIAELYVDLLTRPAEQIAGKTFNAAYENHTVAELGDMVRRKVEEELPELAPIDVETTPSNDLRSYHVSSAKIKRELGWAPRRTVEDAIVDLCRAFRQGKLPNSLTDTRYFNVKTVQASGLK